MLASISSMTIDLSGSTIIEKAESALREAEHHEEFLSREISNVLWLRVADQVGIEIHRFDGSFTASPGKFSGDFLLVPGLGGTETFELKSEDDLKAVARVIRRAIKLARR